MARTNANVGKAAAALERQRLALEYRKAGLSSREIGRKLGVSHTQICEDLKAILTVVQQECKESAEDLIWLERERLDTALTALHPKVMKGNVAAIEALRKNSESRRRLLGLDKPVKVAPTSPDGRKPYTPLDAKALENMDPAELARLYREKAGEVG